MARAFRSWRTHEALADDPAVCRGRARDRNRAPGAVHVAVDQPSANRQAPQAGLNEHGARQPIDTDYHASDKIACDI
ncbi:hypothetical protein BO443_20320 [Burkholderia orbicola]